MELNGIYVPLVTPFAADGTVAAEALEGLANEVLDQGAAGLVALGTTGEPATLDEDERRTVTEVCTRVCRERGATLIVGAGSSDTRRSARQLAELDGADAALVAVPSFTRPGEAGVLAHFEHLTAHSAVPLIVYYIPYRTGQPLSAATLRRLLELPGVAGVKYAAGGIDDGTVELLAGGPAGVLGGDDVVFSPLLALGAPGGILASAHLATGRFVELVDAWRKGDAVSARSLGHRLAPLSGSAFAEPNPSVIKGVLHAQGRIPTPDVRLPLLPAGEPSVTRTLGLLAALDG
ncbi:dihydrodipicolinate synthase family protein [Kitasatospora sp. GP82]|uniref:dihydrodipicolinate synthase family protein n=1 Tax=Kitasatospora sp. GP82 TaxID=3035089 RepID=UPI002473F02B|nr:dihydrodipicolinate synthase family protein [Kitasatospora sp. GP82]MDH6127184.1 4-hydroxy-tetrahydrodipicolinate synthase [Kitasatospora sp. GP82]